jgi:hypothetical protein
MIASSVAVGCGETIVDLFPEGIGGTTLRLTEHATEAMLGGAGADGNASPASDLPTPK